MKRQILLIVLLISTLNSCKNKTDAIETKGNVSIKNLLIKTELELHNTYKKILEARFNQDSIRWNTLEIENEKFETQMLKYISESPESITYPFDSLRAEQIDIVNSEDNLLRIYSWDTWKGGTMHDFENLFQYKSNEKVFTEIIKDTVTHGEGEYIPFYSEIFTLKNKGVTYYLCVYDGIYSTKDASQSIKFIKIEDSKIKDVKLIKTEKGFTNSIDLNFDFFSIVDRPERPLRLIKYDSKKKEIYIPILSDKEEVTNHFQVYKFNGEYFETKQ